jgi:hypothetical protein
VSGIHQGQECAISKGSQQTKQNGSFGDAMSALRLCQEGNSEEQHGEQPGAEIPGGHDQVVRQPIHGEETHPGAKDGRADAGYCAGVTPGRAQIKPQSQAKNQEKDAGDDHGAIEQPGAPGYMDVSQLRDVMVEG